MIVRDIASADTAPLKWEIDQRVYKLGVYPAGGGRLTEEEIAIVEGVKK